MKINSVDEKFTRRIEFANLAVKHNAVHLGQGFIDYDPPKYVMDICEKTAAERITSLYQYTRGYVNFKLKLMVDHSVSSNRVIDD